MNNLTVPSGFVVDASVAAKWHLTEENDTERASRLLIAFDSGRLDLAAPALIRYEVAQALERAEREGRLATGMASSEFDVFLSYGIHQVSDPDELVISARRLAQSTGASVYDALYVVYAESIQYDLVTADEQLLRQMAAYDVPAHHLSELDLS